LKAELCVRANGRFDDLCRQLDVPFSRCGSLMVSFGPKADAVLRRKYETGLLLGVPGLRLLSGAEAAALEPSLAPGVSTALFAPTAGTVNPWELGIAACENAAANGIRNAKFIKADAGDFMTALADRGESADAVFLDPPRSGCSPAFLAACLKLAPSRIVYVSCGPESLARDLAVLTKGGYAVSAIQPFDLFPFTEHSESVVLMSRGG